MKIIFNYPVELRTFHDGEEQTMTVAADRVWDCVWEMPLMQRQGDHELLYRGHVNIETVSGLLFMRVPVESYRYACERVTAGKDRHA